MNTDRFEGTSFGNGDQLDLHRGRADAMTFEELQRNKQAQQYEAVGSPERPVSPELQVVERVLTTGRFLNTYRQNHLEEQQETA